MISCALTLPTFGNASSSADTFILPRTSSLSASLSTWVRLVPPRLSRSLSSARARRAAAAFSNAAARCSSVNWGRATIPPSLIDKYRSFFVSAGYSSQRRRPYSRLLTKSNPPPRFRGHLPSVGHRGRAECPRRAVPPATSNEPDQSSRPDREIRVRRFDNPSYLGF